MRLGSFWAVLAMSLCLLGCAPSSPKPMKDMVGYVPPTSLPSPAKRTLVGDPIDVVWDSLVDFLESSAFEIERIDRSKNLVIAQYSGDPEPYVDCGSIVTHQGGVLSQLAGSAQSSTLNYQLEEKAVVLNRSLNLDSRIIITLSEQDQGTVVATDTAYVVTKTIDVTDAAGTTQQGNRETISFSAGGRGEFGKGTSCQPNGFLHLAVLESLPNVIGSDEIDRAGLPNVTTDVVVENEVEDESVEVVADDGAGQATDEAVSAPESRAPGDVASLDVDQTDAATTPTQETTQQSENSDIDWVLPKTGLPTAALPAPEKTAPSDIPDQEANASEASVADETEQTALLAPDTPTPEPIAEGDGPSATIVDDTTRKLLETLDCGGEEWHFCDLVEITAPYRKRNITKLFGLTVNTTASFAEQSIGNDLKLDFLFPSFPSYLHVVYARRDGTIDHLLSSSDVWPADLAHRFEQDGKTIPGPPGLAMIVAIATDEPFLPSPPSGVEEAEAYLASLKSQLAEVDTQGPDGKIAASQLLIYVENPGS